jgi:two-component system alkaline phosphatase synthesis response regulator PhoP
MTKILIVEDDNNLGDTLFEYLEGFGHECLLAKTAKEAKEHFSKLAPDIVLMDIGLPDGSGLEIARQFRDFRKDFALLFLSALNDPETKVEGLEIGAEDYITKPFALKELMIRLDRLKSFKEDVDKVQDELNFGKLKVWFKRYEVQDGEGNVISLSQKECAILKFMWMNKDEALTRDQIIDKVWGEDKFPSHRTVDNYIVKLRKWAETDTGGPLEIQSIRGIGYKLTIK